MLSEIQIQHLLSLLNSNQNIFGRNAFPFRSHSKEIICIDDEPQRKNFWDVLRTKKSISKKRKFLFRATGNVCEKACPICLSLFKDKKNIKYSFFLIEFEKKQKEHRNKYYL